MADVAPGFRFCPNDQEIINEYLKPKVLGDNWCNFIPTVKLYDPKSTPWQLFDVNDDKSWTDSPKVTLKEKYLYVFTKLSKLRCSESSKESIRENTGKKAGGGTWVGRTKRKSIKDRKDNVVIGEQRMLVFVINNVGDQFDIGNAGHFRMHEYSLSGVNKALNPLMVMILFSVRSRSVLLRNLFLNWIPKVIIMVQQKKKRGKGQDRKQNKNKNKEILERSGRDNLEGNMNSTSTAGVEINSGVAENIEGSECLTAENLFVMDRGVGDSMDCLAAADQFDDGSNDYGWDASFTGSFMALLNSEEGEVEDISQLGKRKIEEESFCRSKKMCF